LPSENAPNQTAVDLHGGPGDAGGGVSNALFLGIDRIELPDAVSQVTQWASPSASYCTAAASPESILLMRPQSVGGQIANDTDWIHGRHDVGFGVSYIGVQTNERNVQRGNGTFAFNGSITGDPLADFLLGRPSSVNPAEPRGDRAAPALHRALRPGCAAAVQPVEPERRRALGSADS
jgi:hypothetical protein